MHKHLNAFIVHSERNGIEPRITFLLHSEINKVTTYRALYTWACTHIPISVHISTGYCLSAVPRRPPFVCFEGSCTHVSVFLYSASLDEGSSSASALSGQVPIYVSCTVTHKVINMPALYAVMMYPLILPHLVRIAGWLYIGNKLWIKQQFNYCSSIDGRLLLSV